ncbi:MAG: alpha/beta fold hydrolase [Candidatus Limnocylindria bacterium]
MPSISVQGRKVYYEVHGEAGGVPLVLVMGMGGSCRGWLPLQVPDFSQKRRTLIFDHRGVGGSEDPGGPFSTRQMADDTAGLLDALSIERADVLGVFMGGMVAQELALGHPGRVDRLVLVGTYARPDATRRLLLQQWRDLARSGASVETLVRERLLWTLQDETLEQQDLIDAMVEFFTRDGAPLTEDVFARQCEACLQHDAADRLRQIRQRTMVICGRQDALTPPKFHRELADEIPGAHLVTISHGAHLVMAESAESFNRAVLQFLGEGRDRAW